MKKTKSSKKIVLKITMSMTARWNVLLIGEWAQLIGSRQRRLRNCHELSSYSVKSKE